MKTTLRMMACVAQAWALCSATSALAQGNWPAKPIRLIVPQATGGSNDTYSRMIAQHMGKHIPGNPQVVVQNMIGEMQTRAELYKTIGYHDYEALDQSIISSVPPETTG